jgi:radical SAM protein with 4Fe4S-binding SPASM domain
VEIPLETYVQNVLKDDMIKDLWTFEMTGGEPMLYSNIFELTEQAFQLLPSSTQIRIGTNGIALHKTLEYIDTFKNRPLFFALSIDGIGSAHDRIRGVDGNFESVSTIISRIQELRDGGSPMSFGASVCVSKLNINHLTELTNYLAGNSIPFQLTPVIFPEYAQSDFAREQIDALDFRTPEEKEEVASVFDKYNKETYRIFSEFWRGQDYPCPPCYALREFAHLRPDGDVQSCMWLHKSLGNINDNTLSEIWKGVKADSLRQELYTCTACNRVHPNLCDSLNNYQFHGTLYTRIWSRLLKRKLGVAK